MIRRLDSKPCCKAQQLLRGYDRLRLPQPHVHANRRNKASPFMTGPFVPVRILNPIRAVVGIPHHRFNLFVKCSRSTGLAEVSIFPRSYATDSPTLSVMLYVKDGFQWENSCPC